MPSFSRSLSQLLVLGLAGCIGKGSPSDVDTSAADRFSVRGLITALDGSPVVDLFVTVSTEFCIPDRTDLSGGFEVERVHPGPVRLITYGETATSGLVASVSFSFEAAPGHVFEAPIKLPRLEQTWPLDPDATEAQHITTDAGLSIRIEAGALNLAPFAPPELQVARVPIPDAPALVPEGTDLVDLFVLHPILSTLDPPAAIRFPADSGLVAGTAIRFHTLDYTLGQMVVVATGTVDEDGRPSTDAGQGIPELTWVGISVEDEG